MSQSKRVEVAAERRALKRRRLMYYLPVVFQESGAPLGRLLDLSTGGFMLISEQPVEVFRAFHLQVDLGQGLAQKGPLSFTAQSRWCRQDVNPSYWDTGFAFVDLSPEAERLVELLSRNVAFRS